MLPVRRLGLLWQVRLPPLDLNHTHGTPTEYPWWQPFRNESTLEKQYRLLLNTSSCNNIDCLRRLPSDKLAKATQSTYDAAYADGRYSYGDFFYGPSVDGEIIRQLPSQEFKQGHFTRVPLFVNHNAYEGYLWTNQSLSSIAEETKGVQTLFPNARRSFISRLFELYPASDYNSTFFQRAKWYGDFIINCPTYYMASAVSDYGNPVYKFRFAAGNELHGAVASFVQTLPLNGEPSFPPPPYFIPPDIHIQRNRQQHHPRKHHARLLRLIRSHARPERKVVL